jgi:signal transduction histidine kinase
MSWKWLTGKSLSGTFIRLDNVDPAMSGILGCLSEISYQEEWMREAERCRVEAEESKRQQELLVVTLHEIRTPVSAILHCSSLAKDNLVAFNEQIRIGTVGFEPNGQLIQQIEEGIEASESMLRQKVSLTSGIYQCGLVQGRIANDVLSFARVQRDMLTFNNREMDPRKEARLVGSPWQTGLRQILVVFAPCQGATSTNKEPV